MNYLKKITLRSLKLNKKRTIVTIIGIVLSVALIVATSSLVFSIKESMINYEKYEVGNFHYYFGNVPKNDISFFKENRIFESVLITKELGFAKDNNIKTAYKPYLFINAYNEQALQNLNVHLISGRLPENDSEILIPEHLNKNGETNYNIGETLYLEIGTRNKLGEDLDNYDSYNKEEPEIIVNTSSKKYTIVGTIKRLNEAYNFPGYIVITKLEDISLNGNYDIYTRYTKESLNDACHITANILNVDYEALNILYYTDYYNGPITDEIIELRQEMSEKMNEAKYTFSIHNSLISFETSIFREEIMKFILLAVIIAIIIIVFTSVFCIKNSFNISITEKIKQYGHLNTIGATSKQIKDTVYYEAFILGLIGIPIGIILGFIISFIILFISKLLLQESIGVNFVFGFSWIPIFIAIVLGFITILLSSMSSANKASKIIPLTAINNSEDIKFRKSSIKSPKYVKKIFGIGGDISYKNLKRSRKKYRTTVFAIVICITIFIGISTFINISFDKVNKEFKTKDYNMSIDVRKANDNIYNIVNFENIINYSIVKETIIIADSCEDSNYTQEYIDFYNPGLITEELSYIDNYGVERKTCSGIKYGITVRVYRLGDNAYKEYLKELGLKEENQKNKGILIDTIRDMKYNYDIKRLEPIDIKMIDFKQGDVLNYYFYTYEEDKYGNKLTDEYGYTKREYVNIEVGHTTNKLPFGISYDISSALMIVSDEYYNELFDTIKNNNYDKETIFINTNNATELQDKIVEYLKDSEEGSYYLNNIDAEERTTRNLYTMISILLYGFIIIVAFISVTNIFNTITSNMLSRSKEFATLKSIGMTRSEFNKMIRLESLFYGTKSLVLGITLGYLLSRLIDFVMSIEDATIIYEFPTMQIIISVLTVFLSTICIMKYSVSKINKQNIIETIRNENI